MYDEIKWFQESFVETINSRWVKKQEKIKKCQEE